MKKNDHLEIIKEFLSSDTTTSNITKVILATIAVSSIPFIVVGGVALGNAIQIFDPKKYKKRQISNTLSYLRKEKLVEYVSDNKGITTVRLTKNGEVKIKSFAIDLIKIESPNKWDKKWRIVMFDLPIKYKKARESLRFKLIQLGFIQFQKSVWIYPYPCVDEILFIADYYKIGKYVEILEVSDILHDDKIRKSFNI